MSNKDVKRSMSGGGRDHFPTPQWAADFALRRVVEIHPNANTFKENPAEGLRILEPGCGDEAPFLYAAMRQGVKDGDLYGVDIDAEAAELASVNLILQALRRGRTGLHLNRLPQVGQSLLASLTGLQVLLDQGLLRRRKAALKICRKPLLNLLAFHHRSPMNFFRQSLTDARALKSLDLTVPSGMRSISLISS